MSEFIQPISSSQPDPAISADNQDILSSLSQSIPEMIQLKNFKINKPLQLMMHETLQKHSNKNDRIIITKKDLVPPITVVKA